MLTEISSLETELQKIQEARARVMEELSQHHSNIAAEISRQAASIEGMKQIIVKNLPPTDTGYSISDLMIIEGKGKRCAFEKIAQIAIETRTKHNVATSKLSERMGELKKQESEYQNKLLKYTLINRIHLGSGPVAEIIVVQDNKIYPALIYFTLNEIIKPDEVALDISKLAAFKNEKVTTYEVRHPSRLADPQMLFSKGLEHAIRQYADRVKK